MVRENDNISRIIVSSFWVQAEDVDVVVEDITTEEARKDLLGKIPTDGVKAAAFGAAIQLLDSIGATRDFTSRRMKHNARLIRQDYRGTTFLRCKMAKKQLVRRARIDEPQTNFSRCVTFDFHKVSKIRWNRTMVGVVGQFRHIGTLRGTSRAKN